MIAINIVWDTDGHEVSLPTRYTIPSGIADRDIADFLSDGFGWLVISFDIQE